MKSKYPIRKLIRLYFWLTFNFLILGFGSIIAGYGIHDIRRAIIISAGGTVTLIANIVVNLTLLMIYDYYKVKKSFKGHVIFICSSYTINLVIYLLITSFNSNSFFQHNSTKFSYIFAAVFCIAVNTLILILQNYIILQEEKAKVDLENSKLRAANFNASNQLLRQQIHPHFLFNSLNTLKSLFKVDTSSGEKYLIHLSDFLRAAVSKNDTKVIPLKDEIKLCEDYIEMQKIRFNDALTCSVAISDEALNNGFVPSFSIQPLLENAIKHNELTEESPLHIKIKQLGNRIEVANNLKSKRTSEISTGSGLINLSERYKLLSNDDLIINQTDDTFSVSIKILNHENSHN